MPSFTHLTPDGDAHMVDVGDKIPTRRSATASARVTFPPDVYAALRASGGQTKKGAIITTAQLAGIMAAKQTANLIPLCHPLPLDKVELDIAYNDAASALDIHATCRVTHKTGVEMEALTAASIAALTLYDMCKALSHDITISDIRLEHKSGGKHDYTRPQGNTP